MKINKKIISSLRSGDVRTSPRGNISNLILVALTHKNRRKKILYCYTLRTSDGKVVHKTPGGVDPCRHRKILALTTTV